MKVLLTGNEAVARGAYEAGVIYASAYPGTPSTEILENLTLYEGITSEWSPNEKVALEAVMGASFGGGRAMAAMKHVGLNVAADPFFTFSYTGVNAGAVIISADEPGQHSAQNEQDNRNYAKAAKVPMFEASDSQECLDMIKEAYDISEEYDLPVLFRMTTRLCHGKSVVETGERQEKEIKEFVKNPGKYVMVPGNARIRRVDLESRLERMKEYSENTRFNRTEINNKKIGVITSGMCYQYAKEVFGDTVSYLKLGFTNPMPDRMIETFAKGMDRIYVIEENDPYIEERVRILGFDCEGKNLFPKMGEMTADVIRKSVYGKELDTVDYNKDMVVPRPPTLCAGCPHRGFFYRLGKKKNIMISGDIGCYTLGFAKPYNAIDTTVCMGASISMGHGAQKVFDKLENGKRVVSVIGDSTFFHTGINSLMTVIYNGSNTINVILDNRVTAMTGHQENPGSGKNACGGPAPVTDIEDIVRALGFKNIRTINPNDLDEVEDALNESLALDEPSVIITRWPCALKKLSAMDMEEFKGVFSNKNYIEEEVCIGCRKCVRSGCPALVFNKEKKKTAIDLLQCVGCDVCTQLCPTGAIRKKVD
ncbi:MAG: indolepyruvate ferredoxin oxidoreductase subunit alpha [Anaerovoracaceae bacterium]